MYCSYLASLLLQVAKAHPNDRDARMKFTECSKIVKRIAFEKAISVSDTKKSVVDQINLESMSMLIFVHFENVIGIRKLESLGYRTALFA